MRLAFTRIGRWFVRRQCCDLAATIIAENRCLVFLASASRACPTIIAARRARAFRATQTATAESVTAVSHVLICVGLSRPTILAVPDVLQVA